METNIRFYWLIHPIDPEESEEVVEKKGDDDAESDDGLDRVDVDGSIRSQTDSEGQAKTKEEQQKEQEEARKRQAEALQKALEYATGKNYKSPIFFFDETGEIMTEADFAEEAERKENSQPQGDVSPLRSGIRKIKSALWKKAKFLAMKEAARIGGRRLIKPKGGGDSVFEDHPMHEAASKLLALGDQVSKKIEELGLEDHEKETPEGKKSPTVKKGRVLRGREFFESVDVTDRNYIKVHPSATTLACYNARLQSTGFVDLTVNLCLAQKGQFKATLVCETSLEGVPDYYIPLNAHLQHVDILIDDVS